MKQKIFYPRFFRYFQGCRVLLLILVLFCSCKKIVDVPPPTTAVTGANVYKDDATATAVLTGIYANFSSASVSGGGINSLSFLPSISADELSLDGSVVSPQYSAFYQNNLNSNIAGFEYWNDFYPIIFVANSAITGLNNANSLTPAKRKQLLGEAKFIRAFCYFYLVNLYGDVPLVTTIDYSVNAQISRTPKEQVWSLIIDDLTDAKAKLSEMYLDGTLTQSSADRVRPTTWAASALLARAYLYSGRWADAETESSRVITQTGLFRLSALGNAFLRSSLGNNEAIWQLQPVFASQNTPDAVFFVLPSTGPSSYNPCYLSKTLLNAFEAGDQRKNIWVGKVTANGTNYYFPNKYKVNESTTDITEHETVLRLSEQYLIRAEARAELGESNASDDLNQVRQRAGLTNYSGSTTQAALLSAIYQERQVELFTEWGHRWLDLKRLGIIDSVMTPITTLKGGTWSSFKQYYPLPLTDLRANPKLVQNTGY